MRYLFAMALVTASISRSADPAGRCQSRSSACFCGESGMVAAACAGRLATIPSSRADEAETIVTSTTASMANTAAGARCDFANRLRTAVLRPAKGKRFGIENLRMLFPASDRDAMRVASRHQGGRPGVTLLQSALFLPGANPSWAHRRQPLPAYADPPRRKSRPCPSTNRSWEWLRSSEDPRASPSAQPGLQPLRSVRSIAGSRMLQCTSKTVEAKAGTVKQNLLQCN